MAVRPVGIRENIAVENEHDLNVRIVNEKKILTDLRAINQTINGSGARRCQSWIESFVKFTDNIEAPEIFRQWAAIGTIAAVLEQKVWLQTSAPLYPNLYTFLVGLAGVGKTRTITQASRFLLELPEPHIAPTSMTMASLTDCLAESKRMLSNIPHPPQEYHSMVILADELSAFMPEWNQEIVGGLTTFYDVETLPYGQARRSQQLRIKIKKPQLNIVSGTTPSNLIKLMPEHAWDQGLVSRIILVFSNERPKGDDFAYVGRDLPKEMLNDIRSINNTRGPFAPLDSYVEKVRTWRNGNEEPKPSHPRLETYCARRKAHLYKLSIVAAVDRGSPNLLEGQDFDRAMGWLTEAEMHMADIFRLGYTNPDGRAMDEIAHHIRGFNENRGMSEMRVMQFATGRVAAHMVRHVLEIMVRSGRIEIVNQDRKTKQHTYKATE